MDNVLTIDDRFRTGKAYTVRQAADLAGVSPGTVRNWLYGSSAPSGYEMEPIFGTAKAKRPEQIARLSFLELSELIVAARFRKLRIKLPRIRAGHDYAKSRWGLEFPFAHLKLTSVGGHILREFEEADPAPGGRFVVLSSPNQYVLPGIIKNELEQFDYSEEDSFAERWYPFGRDVPAVLDPRFAGGKLTIRGRGVSVDIVSKRWRAGEKVASIASDFKLSPPDIEAVLQHVA